MKHLSIVTAEDHHIARGQSDLLEAEGFIVAQAVEIALGERGRA